MKKIISSLSIVLLCSTAFGQEKQTVHSIIVEWHEADWYQTQMGLWKKEIDLNSKNMEAWINYYSSVRALRNSTYGNDKLQREYAEQGHQIAKDAYAANPESFEGNYIMYWDGSLGQNDESYLLKAYALRPEDPRVLLDMLIRSEINRDQVERTKIAKKLYEINRMPSGALNWAYNALTEMPEKGIILTAGDNDTYAVWIVQEAMAYRKDVTVINTSMIFMPEYREQLFNELGIAQLKAKKNDYSFEEMFSYIFNNTVGIPVNVSGTAIGQFNDTVFSKDLYLTGLTYQFSKIDIENIAVIKRNFEKRFLLDHLTRSFSYSFGDLDSRIKHMYLPGLIKLYQHYKTADEREEMDRYKRLIDAIAKELQVEEDVIKALEEK